MEATKKKAYKILNLLGFEVRIKNDDETLTVYPARQKREFVESKVIDEIMEIIRE